mgnify:CR=1 FL=1
MFVGDHGGNRDRRELLKCCCASPRADRHLRLFALEKASGGVCSDAIQSGSTPVAFGQKMSGAKFAISMVGFGRQCFRDTEVGVTNV